jgi:hypothetical protein
MNTEAKTRRVNWHQAIAEVTLIILGILGALAVDSWWDEKAKREAEIDYLESLRADFIATRDSLNTQIEWEQRLISDGKDIHANIASGLIQLSSEEFLQKISDFYWFSSWEPITATYDELIGSGHLEYIQSQTLRTTMGEYVLRVERLIDYRGRQITDWQLSHRPFVYKHIIVSDLGWISDYRPVSPFKNSYSGLESKEFWNLVSDWMVWHNTILTNYQRVLEDGEEILELIDSELAKKIERNE